MKHYAPLAVITLFNPRSWCTCGLINCYLDCLILRIFVHCTTVLTMIVAEICGDQYLVKKYTTYRIDRTVYKRCSKR